MPLSEHVYCVAIAFKMTEWVEQRICIKFCIKLEHSSTETNGMIHKATAVGNEWLATSLQRACSHITSCSELPGKTSNHPGDPVPYSPDLAPCDFWLFPKLKSLLKGRRFKTLVDEIQENRTGQLMAIGRMCEVPRCLLWGKGTEASLSYVQCFFCILYLLQYMSLFFILNGWIPSGQASYIG